MHTVRSAKGLVRMCCCSRTVYPDSDSPAVEGKYDQRMLLSEMCSCADFLNRVFARPTRRFVKPRDCRRYIRLAKALIRLLMCRLGVCRLIRQGFIAGFAMHRPMRDLFAQTITPNTLGKMFNRRYFEIFFSFFQENRICISCRLSPLHE